MKWLWLALVVALACAFALAAPLLKDAKAETRSLGPILCGPYSRIVGDLEPDYGEQMIGAGITMGNQFIWYLYMHRTGRSWTLLRTETNGPTCVMATRTDWGEIDPWAPKPRKIDHHAAPPHSWISPQRNGEGYGCCGPNDIVEIPFPDAAGVDVGSHVTATFPTRGERTVTVNRVYPSQDGKNYLTFYGCFFKVMSM